MPSHKFPGKRIHDVTPPDVAAKCIQFLERALESGEIQIYEYQVPIAGELRHYEVRMNASMDEKVVTIIRDVTDRMHMEEQLRQSQRMKALTSLARRIGHEFNNMLTTIMVQADLMDMSLNSSNVLYDNVEEIKRMGERAASIIRQLQLFGGKKEFIPESVDLNEIVINTKRTIRLFLDEGIELADHLRPELGRIKADPGHIQQILLTLTATLRETMRKAGNFSIRTANVEIDEAEAQKDGEISPGSFVMLAVSDGAVGLDEEIRRHAYDPSFITKGINGTADPGLSGIYSIVKHNGGHIRAYGNPRGGTTFLIYFPRMDTAEETKEPPPQARERTRTREKETLLLVEDNIRVLKSIAEVLRRNGYLVIEARSGNEALQVFARHEGRVCLTITDVKMPSMSGPELTKQLLLSDPDMKVLYISGFPKDIIFPGGVMNYGTALLEKPFTREGLINKVRKLIDMPTKGKA